MEKRKHRTDDEKRALINSVTQMLMAGVTLKEACRKYSIVETSYRNWKKKFDRDAKYDSKITAKQTPAPNPISHNPLQVHTANPAAASPANVIALIGPAPIILALIRNM